MTPKQKLKKQYPTAMCIELEGFFPLHFGWDTKFVVVLSFSPTLVLSRIGGATPRQAWANALWSLEEGL